MSEVLTEKEQKTYLLSKIGKPVHFTYPEPPYHFKGTLKDRCVVKAGGDASVTYWNMIDLIEFENEKEDWLRLTYYRYKSKEKRWVFAGQTSLSDPISHFEKLFTTAIKEKAWIRPLFKKIFNTCTKELEARAITSRSHDARAPSRTNLVTTTQNDKHITRRALII